MVGSCITLESARVFPDLIELTTRMLASDLSRAHCFGEHFFWGLFLLIVKGPKALARTRSSTF